MSDHESLQSANLKTNIILLAVEDYKS